VIGAEKRPPRPQRRPAPALGASAAALAAALAAAPPAPGCAAWQEPGRAAAGRSPPRQRDRPDDSDLAALIPAGVETVIQIDIARLRASPWTGGAFVIDDTDAGARQARARKVTALGYDDLADVDRTVYAVTAAGAAAPTLVLTQGRLDRARVEEAFGARWKAAAASPWRGVSVLSSGENAIALPTARTLISGPPAAVRLAVDRALGLGDGIDADPALGPVRRALVGPGLPGVPALLAASAVGPSMRARAAEAFTLPRELRQLGVRVDLGETLDVEALAVLDDRAAAEVLARRLRAALGAPAVRFGLGAMGLGAIARASIAAVGAEVRLRASVPAAERPEVSAAIRKLIDSLRADSEGEPQLHL
jgi:hypothetical protein